MVYSPFDFNEASRHRVEHVEDRLREGSPVVGVSFDAGLLLLTVRQAQRKVYEVYDRLIYAGIGKQADVEQIRQAAIDVAHKEGFDRSPDDVTAHRLVTFALSPPIKRLFGDITVMPPVIRALFGELGETPADDLFFVLNYDGEFSQSGAFAAIGGTQEAEDRMALWLMGVGAETTREQALDRALKAWAVGAMEARRARLGDEDEPNPLRDIDESEQIAGFLREELKTGQVEVGLLERFTSRESKFRLLTASDLGELLTAYR